MAKRRHRRGRRKKGNWFSRLTIGKKIGVCFGGLILALASSGVVYVAAKLGQLDTQEIPKEDIVINEGVEQLASLGEGYLNVALFGVDSREGDLEKNTRTDCIIVASLNKETKEIKMASVYRDTLLDLSEGTLQKCNAAYSFGGPKQAINMLNMNLDLDIQNYVTVDFGVVAEVVDLLGGLDIEIKEEEVEPLNKFVYETGQVAGKEAHFVGGSGIQHLDGVQATTYARIRSTAGGDFTRTERQRLVIEKIVEKMMKSDLATINKIIDEVFPTISTNFTMTEILSYAKYFNQYKLGENTGFPIDKATDTISGLGSIVIPVSLEDNVKKLHEFLFGTEEGYTPSDKVQSISNKIVARVGQKKAEDDASLNSKTYEADPQEAPEYTPSRKPQSSGSNSNNSSGNNSGGNNQSGGGSSSQPKPDEGNGNSGNSGSGGSTDQGSGDSGSGSEGTGTEEPVE
ncbi:putative uncharacterized protein [Dorea sp. CAG:317]|nr:putative uncharacterized protein [Dorea sp. CAG:317]